MGILLFRGDGMSQTVKRSKKSQMKKRSESWDDMKMEIAKELGLWEKVEAEGWPGLSAAESGRIGGILSRRRKAAKDAVAAINENENEKKASED